MSGSAAVRDWCGYSRRKGGRKVTVPNLERRIRAARTKGRDTGREEGRRGAPEGGVGGGGAAFPATEDVCQQPTNEAHQNPRHNCPGIPVGESYPPTRTSGPGKSEAHGGPSSACGAMLCGGVTLGTS
ncbi:hypothetical protein E2C01_058618 [Portunus trituberculatus]|uniref:Uncharacterized protein n=1 Tax=Portunus trituberculatus TaxID=210409 RepID=A0A5B7GWZ8_PORTR|nr:hypothetical protein [Portunus trituberculatus]